MKKEPVALQRRIMEFAKRKTEEVLAQLDAIEVLPSERNLILESGEPFEYRPNEKPILALQFAALLDDLLRPQIKVRYQDAISLDIRFGPTNEQSISFCFVVIPKPPSRKQGPAPIPASLIEFVKRLSDEVLARLDATDISDIREYLIIEGSERYELTSGYPEYRFGARDESPAFAKLVYVRTMYTLLDEILVPQIEGKYQSQIAVGFKDDLEYDESGDDILSLGISVVAFVLPSIGARASLGPG